MKLSNDPVHMNPAAASAAVLFLSIALTMLVTGCRSVDGQKNLPMRVAHRGGAALAPENTMAAFANGLELGADALELDVHLSRDGVIMVMHDPLLKRTTNQQGAIADYDAAVLQGFDAAVNYTGAGDYGVQSVPTLRDVLLLVEQAPRTVWLQIEIKLKSESTRYEGLEEKLVTLLTEHGYLEKSVIISFDFPSLEKIRELSPGVLRGALISKKYMTGIGTGGPGAVAKEMKDLGVDYVGINYQYLSQTLYNQLRSAGLKIGAWTVNDAAVMKRLADMGVDFLTSDYPDILVKTIP